MSKIDVICLNDINMDIVKAKKLQIVVYNT
jgi:hypothetical protein